MVKHILVAIDGSENAKRAAHAAADLAKQLGAKLTLLVAVRPPASYLIPPFDALSITPSSPDPAHLAAAQELIDDIIAELGHGVAVPQTTVGADAALVITTEAARLHADLVVVGARGLGALERILLGSVSDRVVRESAGSVLVVR